MSVNQPAALHTATRLDLAQPRVIQLHAPGRTFSVTCRRILREDWLAFYAKTSTTEEQRGNQRVVVNDFDSALVALVEYAVIDATGYTLKGGGTLTELPGWQARLPLAHRRQIGAALVNVQVSELGGDFGILPEGEEVFLDATWSAFGAGMQFFTGLRHQFKTPSAAQHKRYNEASSRSIVVGGSRSGKTVYAGTQRTLAELYDELIVEVEGYRAGDTPLTSRAAIAEHMDTQHKVTAARELFNPRASVTLENEGDGE